MIDENEEKFLKQEVLNVIAKKLRVEYQDFKEVEDETNISPELAENLHAQIKNVFKILKENGVNF